MKTNKKGISLIVLIITILVMIIIAAAIILYLDDAKVVKNAKKAVTMNNMSVAKEVVAVARAEWRANREKMLDEGYNTFVEYAEDKLEEAGFEWGTNGGQVEVSESGLLYAYVEPIIPEGYTASSVSTEDDVSDGLVIYEGDESVTSDNHDDAMKDRNQFVWIPVPNMSEFVRKDYPTSGSSVQVKNSTSYNLDAIEEANMYNAMKESVAKYGGFYIARYEAGKEENIIVSKKDVDVWNLVDWQEAKNVAESYDNDAVVGHMIYGEEWDATLQFISKYDSDYPTAEKQGNFVDVVEKAGFYSKQNIYDMAGNVWEWTMEYFYDASKSEDTRIVRGGDNDNVNARPATRGYKVESNVNEDYGFRMALYLK